MRIVIVQYKNLTRWDVKYFASSLYSGDNLIALREFLIPRTEKIKKDDYDGNLGIVEKITFSNGVIHFRDERKTGMDLFRGYKGDLLTSKINIHQGAVAICPQYLVCSTHYYLYQIDDKKIIPEYLILALRSNSFLQKIVKLKSSSIKNEIGPKIFLDFKIYAPDLSEQRKIVDYWRKAQKEAQELNRKTKEIEKSIGDFVLTELGMKKKEYKKAGNAFVVWFKYFERWGIGFNDYVRQGLLDFKSKYEITSLGRIILNFQYGTSEKANGIKGIPILRMNNIVSGDLDISNLKYIELSKKEFESLKLKKDDLLFNRTNSKELVGKTAVFNLEGDFVFASYLIRIKIDDKKADSNYINILFNSPIIRNQIDAISRQIIGQANVNTEELSDFKIPLPPLPKQKEIAKKVEAIRAEIAEIKCKANGILEITQREIGKMLKA